MSVSVVVERAAETIGESPHWLPDRQSLLYLDCSVGGVRMWDSNTGQVTKIDLDGKVGFVAPHQRGGFLVGLDQTVGHLDWESKTVSPLAQLDSGTENRINDGKCDAKGRLWAGTMGNFSASPLLDPLSKRGHGAFYSLDKEKNVRKHLDKLSISNGLDWSTDSRILYHIDSVPGKLVAFDFDISAGTIEKPRTILESKPETLAEMGRPDGMTVDLEDKLWVACITGGKVIRLDPETCKVLQTIVLPVNKPTSCCFGGKNYDELFVTSARSGMTEKQVKAQPLSGSVFKITGLGVRGKPSHSYDG